VITKNICAFVKIFFNLKIRIPHESHFKTKSQVNKIHFGQ
jgi:hypothetical protein